MAKSNPKPNQKQLAEAIHNHMAQEYNGPDSIHQPHLVIGPPQSGKSGFKYYLMELNIEFHSKAQAKLDAVTSILFNSVQDRNLLDQEAKALENNRVITNTLLGREPLHIPHLKESSKKYKKLFGPKGDFINAKLEKNFIQIFDDEAHVAVGKDQLLDKLFQKFFGGVPGSDKYDGTFFAAVTATPGSWAFHNKSCVNSGKTRPFKLWYLKPSSEYYGPIEMERDGRFEDNFDLNTAEGRQTFISDVIPRFRKRDYGYFIARVSEKESEIIKEVEKLHSATFKSEVYTYADKNIKRLVKEIHKQEPYHKICFIIDSYQQGKRFELEEEENDLKISPKAFLGGWFERYGCNEIFTIQSVGRNFGHNIINRDYPIYCNQDHIRKYNAFLKACENNRWDVAEEYILNGTHTSIVSKESYDHGEAIIFDDHKSAHEYCIENGLDYQTVNVSKNAEYKDIARDILEKRPGSTGKKDTHSLLVADEPHKEHQASWSKLETWFKETHKEKGELKGKAFLFVRSAKKTKKEDIEDSSMFEIPSLH